MNILQSIKKLNLRDGDIVFVEHSIRDQFIAGLEAIPKEVRVKMPSTPIIFVDDITKIKKRRDRHE